MVRPSLAGVRGGALGTDFGQQLKEFGPKTACSWSWPVTDYPYPSRSSPRHRPAVMQPPVLEKLRPDGNGSRSMIECPGTAAGDDPRRDRPAHGFTGSFASARIFRFIGIKFSPPAVVDIPNHVIPLGPPTPHWSRFNREVGSTARRWSSTTRPPTGRRDAVART